MEESFLSADFISHKAIPFTDLSPFPHQFFLMISYMAESGPCMAMQMTKQAALTTHSASKVHFKPVVMGRQWNAQWEMPQTMAANGMPTRKRPAMHMTSVGSGDTQNAASAIMGKSDTKAAPPPNSTTRPTNNKATNPTPQANKNGLQMMASTTKAALNAKPIKVTNLSPTFCRKVRGLPEAT